MTTTMAAPSDLDLVIEWLRAQGYVVEEDRYEGLSGTQIKVFLRMPRDGRGLDLLPDDLRMHMQRERQPERFWGIVDGKRGRPKSGVKVLFDPESEDLFDTLYELHRQYVAACGRAAEPDDNARFFAGRCGPGPNAHKVIHRLTCPSLLNAPNVERLTTYPHVDPRRWRLCKHCCP